MTALLSYLLLAAFSPALAVLAAWSVYLWFVLVLELARVLAELGVGLVVRARNVVRMCK